MQISTYKPQNLTNHNPKYEEMMTMHSNWRLRHQNWITPKIKVLCTFFQNFVLFSKNPLGMTSVFNLRTSVWFLLNFNGSENKILEKSEYHHIDTWSRFLPGRLHSSSDSYIGKFLWEIEKAHESYI